MVIETKLKAQRLEIIEEIGPRKEKENELGTMWGTETGRQDTT